MENPGNHKSRLGLVVLVLVTLSGCVSVDSTSSENGDTPGTEPTSESLYIVMETTSDWTDFLFDEEVEMDEGMITYYSEDSEGHLDDALLSLSQSLKSATNGNNVSVEAIVRFSTTTPDVLNFGIRRGHLGRTIVHLYEVIDSVAEPIGMYQWAGIDETDEQNAYWFTVDRTSLPVRHGRGGLPYSTTPLDQLTDQWDTALRRRDADEMVSLFWPDATETFVWPERREYIVNNAHQSIRADFAEEPDPSVDFSLISYTPPLYFPQVQDSQPRYILFGSYDGNPSGCDVFWFDERGGDWKIAHHAWKLGVEIPPE
ncbi:MAG: hypothetical protein ACLFR8_02615 [Alkalispirochaeta sp.]